MPPRKTRKAKKPEEDEAPPPKKTRRTRASDDVSTAEKEREPEAQVEESTEQKVEPEQMQDIEQEPEKAPEVTTEGEAHIKTEQEEQVSAEIVTDNISSNVPSSDQLVPETTVIESTTNTHTNGSSSNTPVQTLYVKNLNDKIHKRDLKKSLYFMFSTFGHIIDVVALKTPKMRGQAHIAFADINSAQLALASLQGASMFGKQMRIEFAATKSNAVAKLDGTFKPSAAPNSTPNLDH